MSEIKVNSIKGVGATTAAITVNNTDGTCSANLSNRQSNNLVINGDMRIAERGTSSTASGYGTVDRWQVAYANVDEAITQSQVDVASGTTPYSLGFRKALKATNGNQTSGADANDFVFMFQKIEAQDIATSGWNYTNTNSFVTLSFWVKSSVAQNYFGYLKSEDPTQQSYAFETGALTADTWTKITKTIAGNSNLHFANDNETGLVLLISPFTGTTYTDGSVNLNQWQAYVSGTRMPNHTTTWWTTNDSTFEITGVQLEVSDHATSFQFRTPSQELSLCQRYFYLLAKQVGSAGADETSLLNMAQYTSSQAYGNVHFPCSMRTAPDLIQTSGTNFFRGFADATQNSFNTFTLIKANTNCAEIRADGHSASGGEAIFVRTNANTASVAFSAEL